MKIYNFRFTIYAACWLLTVARMSAATTAISGLTSISAPSTNTYFELADMSATPKSRKIWLLDLATSLSPFLYVKVNGTNVTAANFTNSSTVTFAVSGGNVSATAVDPTKVPTSGGTATNLSIAGGTVTSTNLTWNTQTLSPSSGTNYVLDFLAPRTALIVATNDVNFLNSTNRTASTATELSKKVRIQASGANRTVTLHSSWMLVGATTRTFTVTNNTYLVMALDDAGASETNVFAGAVYAQ